MFAANIDQCVYDFNCRPLGYVDLSWLEKRTRPVVARLRDSGDPQARALASSWLLRRFVFTQDKAPGPGVVGTQTGVQGSAQDSPQDSPQDSQQDSQQDRAMHHFDFDFSGAAKRVLLLDAPALNDVALLLGLSSLTHNLRKCVLRSQQLQLRGLLGEPLFAFFTEHVLVREPVARLVLDSQRRAGLLVDDSLLRTCARFGATLLLLSCDAPGSPSLERARLKFARAMGDVQRARPLPELRRDAVVAFSIDCVIRERHPAWHWLF